MSEDIFPEDLIEASAEICRNLGMATTPTNCMPIVKGLLSDRQRDQWQHISTAPSELMVLVCDVNWPPSLHRGESAPIKVGYLDVSTGSWRIFGASWRPTHWQPLPAAPKGE